MATTSNLTLNALLNVSYGTFTRGTDMLKEIERLTKNGALAGINAANKAGSAKAKNTWSKIEGDLIAAGLKKKAQAFRKEHEEKRRNEEKMDMHREMLEVEIERTKGTAAEKGFKDQKNRLDQRIRQERKSRDLLESIAMKETKARMDLIQAHDDKMNKTRAESLKETGDNIQAAIAGAFSADSLDLAGITESLGGMLTGGLNAAAGAAGAAGDAAGMASLSTVAAGLAAAIGPLVALAGVLAMAYTQTKEMNKELLSSASTFDLVGTSFGDLKSRLTEVRLEIQDVAYDMRLSGDDVEAATKALSEAGITFREFTDITRGTEGQFASFQDVLRSSIKSAYGLGLEVSEVSGYYAKMASDLGYNLDQIEGSFGLISEQAQLAGMRTSDFFGAITQAGTGMALYNFRIGDTATLLTELVGILGEDQAITKLGLEGTFKGMGMQEKYKQTMLGGSKFSGAVKSDLRAQAKAFSESNINTNTEGKAGLKKAGIMGDKGEINTRALATMSGKAFREALETSGLTDTQKRQLVTLKTLSQAEKGQMGVAEATGALSKRGELAAQMAQGSAMFGGKLLSDLHGVERMMAEEVTSRSGEDYDLLARIQLGMTAQYEQMKKSTDPKIQAQIQGKTFEDAVTEGLLNASEEDVNNVVNKKHFSEVEQAARAQLKETRSISQTVTNIIQQLLGRIAVGMEMLVSFFADEDEEKSRAAASSNSIARQEDLVKSIDALDTSISDKKMNLSASTGSDERAKLNEDIKALELEKEAKRKTLSDEEEVHRGISRGQTEGDTRKALLEEKYGAQMGSLTPDQLRAAGLSALVNTQDATWSSSETQDYGDNTRVDFSNMTAEDSQKLAALLEQQINAQEGQQEVKSAQDAQIAIDEQIRDDKGEKKSTEEHEDLIKTLQAMSMQEKLAQLQSYLGMSNEVMEKALKGESEALAAIRAGLEGGEGGFTEAERLLYAGTGLDTIIEPLAQDFIYRGDGTRGNITPIDTADQFFGAKPGGAIDRAITGSGGGKAVVININGGDEGRIYAVVKKVLTETGYSGMKSY